MKKIDEKEALEMKKFNTLYIKKRKEIINTTSFEVEVFCDDIISKVSISPERATKLIKFSAKKCEYYFLYENSFFYT